MRYIRYAFLAALAIVLVTAALANRDLVTLNLLPVEIANLTGLNFSITVPLFLVIFGGVVGGVIVGFVWEWLREHKHRAAAATERREKERLAREVREIKAAGSAGDDDVLALLEDSRKAG